MWTHADGSGPGGAFGLETSESGEGWREGLQCVCPAPVFGEK